MSNKLISNKQLTILRKKLDALSNLTGSVRPLAIILKTATFPPALLTPLLALCLAGRGEG